jgi:hypothetical protein
MAAFFAAIVWRCSVQAVKTSRIQQMNAARGTSFKPDAKRGVGANVSVALVAAFLLVTAIAAVIKSWPN